MKQQCPHRFTYTRDDLFSANSIFSKKECELCGETIVLERRYKTYVIMYVLLLVIALLLLPNLLNNIFPDVSYMAKGLVAVPIFVGIYAFGIYRIMNMATYRTYEAPKKVGSDVYEETKSKTEDKVKKILKKEKDSNPTL